VAPKLEELRLMANMSAAIAALHFIETRLLFGVTSNPGQVPQSRSPSKVAIRQARGDGRFWATGGAASASLGCVVEREAIVGRRLGGRYRKVAPEPVESSMDSMIRSGRLDAMLWIGRHRLVSSDTHRIGSTVEAA
jgi:hypothetical protein